MSKDGLAAFADAVIVVIMTVFVRGLDESGATALVVMGPLCPL